MTDREKLLEFLTAAGFTLDATAERGSFVGEKQYADIPLDPDEDFPQGGTRIIIGSGEGYCGFYCQFDFDADGKFIDHGCYE